jgi:hypothetical protein
VAREAAIAGIVTAIDEYARVNVPGPCPCGEELDNPGDPAVMAIHQPQPGGEGCALEVTRLDLIPGSRGRYYAPRAGHCP